MARSLLVTLSTMLQLGVTSLARAAPAASGDFKPYAPLGTEQVSAPHLVAYAYSLIWLLVLLFVFSIWRRQQQVAAELEQLQRELHDSRPEAAAAPRGQAS